MLSVAQPAIQRTDVAKSFAPITSWIGVLPVTHFAIIVTLYYTLAALFIRVNTDPPNGVGVL
jgi:hypothetical protein